MTSGLHSRAVNLELFYEVDGSFRPVAGFSQDIDGHTLPATSLPGVVSGGL